MEFLNSFEPIYYFSRIIGLLPFKIICNLNGDIEMPRVSMLDRIWFISSILLCLLVAFCVTQPISHDITLSRSQIVLISSDQWRLVLCLIFCAIVIVMDMCNRFKLVTIFKKITIFDRKVSKNVFNFMLDR